jgi:hypothetical protein
MIKIKKAQTGAKTPAKKKSGITYKNLRMGVNADNKSAGSSVEQKPTKADSASYRSGYERGMAGKGPDPAETNTSRMGRWEGQNAKKASAKKKMKNGGSLSGLTASNKRDKGTDVGGAWTKVQKKTLAGAKGKASLTKDKQLGATKMMKKGGSIKKK